MIDIDHKPAAAFTVEEARKLTALAAAPELQAVLDAHEAARHQRRRVILAALAETKEACANQIRESQAVIDDLRPQADALRSQLAEVCHTIEQAAAERGVAANRSDRAASVAHWDMLELGGEAVRATRSALHAERMLALNMSGEYVMPRGSDGVAQVFSPTKTTVTSARVKTSGEHSAVVREVEVRTPTPLGGAQKFPAANERLRMIDALLVEVDRLEWSDMSPASIEQRCKNIRTAIARPAWMPIELTHLASVNSPKLPRAAASTAKA